MSKKNNNGVYIRNILTRKVKLPFNVLGNNIESNILQQLNNNLSGKCVCEGYIKKNSIEIISYSAGKIQDKYIIFDNHYVRLYNLEKRNEETYFATKR